MDPDEYRTTEQIRWVGYASAVGSAIAPLIGYNVIVHFLKFVTRVYVALDIITASRAIYEAEKQPELAAIKGVDVFLFHLLATLVIPPTLAYGFVTILNIIICFSIIPPLIMLGILPLIIQPLDMISTILLDETFRKYTLQIWRQYRDYDLNKIFTPAPDF